MPHTCGSVTTHVPRPSCWTRPCLPVVHADSASMWIYSASSKLQSSFARNTFLQDKVSTLLFPTKLEAGQPVRKWGKELYGIAKSTKGLAAYCFCPALRR